MEDDETRVAEEQVSKELVAELQGATASSAMVLQAALTEFIRRRFQVAPDDTLFGPKLDLWDEGYVDSTGVVEVLAFLEEQVGERIPEDLLFEPAFTTIEGMARLVSEL